MRPGSVVYVKQPRDDVPRPRCRVVRKFRAHRMRWAWVRFDDGEVLDLPIEYLADRPA